MTLSPFFTRDTTLSSFSNMDSTLSPFPSITLSYYSSKGRLWAVYLLSWRQTLSRSSKRSTLKVHLSERYACMNAWELWVPLFWMNECLNKWKLWVSLFEWMYVWMNGNFEFSILNDEWNFEFLMMNNAWNFDFLMMNGTYVNAWNLIFS